MTSSNRVTSDCIQQKCFHWVIFLLAVLRYTVHPAGSVHTQWRVLNTSCCLVSVYRVCCCWDVASLLPITFPLNELQKVILLASVWCGTQWGERWKQSVNYQFLHQQLTSILLGWNYRTFPRENVKTKISEGWQLLKWWSNFYLNEVTVKCELSSGRLLVTVIFSQCVRCLL